MTSQPKQATSVGRRSLIVAAGLIVFVAGVSYSNSLHVPFVLDDLFNIRGNPHVRIDQIDWQQLWDAARRSPCYRRPLSNLTFALNFYAAGYDVWGYHLVNLGIHVACGFVVYLLALKTFGQLSTLGRKAGGLSSVQTSWMALTAALIFVSHPIQTQSVTYTVQRMACMATLFELTSLLLYINGRIAKNTKRRWYWWAGSLGCWLVGLGCKETPAILPLIVLLYEWYFFQDLNGGWLKRCCIYVGLPIALLTLVLSITHGNNVLNWLDAAYAKRDFTMAERLLTQLRVVVYYLSQVAIPLPSRFCLTHDFAISHGLFDPLTTFLSLLVLLALATCTGLLARRYRIVSFGIAWCLLHLVMESTVIPLEMGFEHRMYLPMVGISLLIAWGLFALLTEGMPRTIVIILLMSLLTMATHTRNNVWQSRSRLWEDVVAKYPEDVRAHFNLGHELHRQGRIASASEQLRRALQIDPSYVEARNGLGVILQEQGKLDAAIEQYQQALQINQKALVLVSLANALREQGKVEASIEQYHRAIKLDPKSVLAMNNLAWIRATHRDATVRDGAKAVELAERACELTGYKLGAAMDTLAAAYAEAGRFDEAIDTASKAIDLATAAGEGTLIGGIRERLELYRKGIPFRQR